MEWTTGNWSSVPDDGRVFLELHEHGKWWAYKTDDEGGLLEGFPLACEHGFDTLEEAQAWAMEHLPPAANPPGPMRARIVRESR